MENSPKPTPEEILQVKLSNLEIVDAKSIYDLIWEMKNEVNFHAVRQVEEWLRQNETDIYLVAIPVNDELLFQNEVKLLAIEQEDYPYYIYFCEFGQKERDTKLAEYGLSPDENLENLKQAGFISLRAGSKDARAAKAHLN